MPQFSTTRPVLHSAAEMFDLVADVERYPEFVPLCSSLVVRKRIAEPEGVEILVADMTVAYRLLETFGSRVTLDRPNLHILVEYLQGPFQHARKPLDLSSHRRAKLYHRILHHLRVQEPNSRSDDGNHVRWGFPSLCGGV